MTMETAPDIDDQSYPALTIAKWFIAWAETETDEVSNLKLQKLLYYAQGHHLTDRGRPLFAEEIQAWSDGPAVPVVYRAFEGFGRSNIELPAGEPFTWDDVDRVTADLLIRVWNTYGGYSVGRLRAMVHSEAPWKSHFHSDTLALAIPLPEIAAYFAERPRHT